jgi:beta-glucosidase-like glycosyl hydrolase
MGHGDREVIQKLLTPFKAVFEIGGARGVMMAYSEFDDVPSSVNPIFYDALEEWGYDGFVIADDTGRLISRVHHYCSDGHRHGSTRDCKFCIRQSSGQHKTMV